MKHWLVTLAVRAGLTNTSAITLAPDTPSEEAWMHVMELCGMTEELSRQVARAGRCELVDFNTAEFRAVRLLPEDIVRRHHAFPVRDRAVRPLGRGGLRCSRVYAPTPPSSVPAAAVDSQLLVMHHSS